MSKRDNNFEIDLENALNTINDRTKIIFVASPNNPTGNLASEIQIRALLETGVLVVVDEAYYEFCNSTFANLIDVFDNLVILRTMSKWAGLAGLRIGYGIMNPVLVNHIMDIKSPYNLSVTAEDALVASIDDAGFLLNNVRRILVERDRVFKLLTGIDGLRPIPSSGNYILCEVKDQKKDHHQSPIFDSSMMQPPSGDDDDIKFNVFANPDTNPNAQLSSASARNSDVSSSSSSSSTSSLICFITDNTSITSLKSLCVTAKSRFHTGILCAALQRSQLLPGQLCM